MASRDSVGLSGRELVWTDLSEFESLLGDGRVEDALALCRGELLQELDDDWVCDAREEHRDRVAQALARLATEAEEQGELRRAAEFTRRQVALDPLAEEPQRELIRRLAAGGDRPAALTAYRRLQDRLRSELGLAPSAGTRELVESLRAGSGPGPRPGRDEPPVPERSSAGTAVLEPPSGTVTLLFTDQVNSTEMLQRLGDDEAERLRRAHFRLLREVAAAHGGQEVKNLGDGLMVAFASAVDAVACAIGIQQAVHGHAERHGTAELTVRVGLNVGEPMLDEGDYFGTPVVVAKRLCDAGCRGQILASDVVRALVGTRGGFEFRRLGVVALKGIAEAMETCEICWEPTTAHRIPLPPAVIGTDIGDFVGRTGVLEELRSHWASVTRGQRRVVLLAGEPGIGKTRLTGEFCRAAHAEGATVLAGRCFEEMLIPYQPFVEALRQYVADCPPAELTVQVSPHRRELAALVPELELTPGGASGDRAEAEPERFRLFEAVASLVSDASMARSVVMVLDDLHWADDASLLLLRHIVRATEGSRLMILGTYRKTELEPGSELRIALAELRRARALHQLELGGLAERDVAALIAARVGDDVQESFARQVAERTEGNPLFIEELLRHVDDPAGLTLVDLALPESVTELLLRRLQRLGESCRRALAVAAVAGREFDLAVLGRVLDRSVEELAELLEGAVQGHVLLEEAATIGRYRFAHPLIRETIYGDVSFTRRALLHRRVGEAIESLHAHRLDQHAGTLAHHYQAAGDVEKAFEYHGRAANEAERSSAPETAFEHLTGAIAAGELLGRAVHTDAVMRALHSRRAWIGHFTATEEVVRRDYALALEGARAAGDRSLEMQLLNGLGTRWHVRDSAASARYHEQSLEIAKQLHDTAGQVSALNRLSLVYANQLDLERALELGERALTLARASDDERAESRALDSLKFVALMLGDTRRLEELTSLLADAQRRRQDIWYLQWTLEESAFTPTAHGLWDKAATRLEEALAISQRMGDMMSRGLILEARCRLERARGDYARALEVGHESVRITSHGPGHVWLGWTAGTLGLALADLRAWTEAIEMLETALQAAERIDARAQIFSALGALAWVRVQAGDEAAARAAAMRWDARVEQVRTPPAQAYLYAWHTYTDRARVALALGQLERAEAILGGVREPIERYGLRDASANVHAALAACAAARGERAAAEQLLIRGLQAAGDRGLPASRLEITIALATLGTSHGTAPAPAEAARSLIEQIAGAVGDDELANRFRSSALAELRSSAPAPSYAAAPTAGSRHTTS